MRKFLTSALALILSLACASAQQVDSTLLGASIFNTLPSGVTVRQSAAVRSSMYEQTLRNADKLFAGFRIRIYNESVQGARSLSGQAESRFRALYPSIEAYRSYDAPYFKVVVGDWRTRTDAEKALRLIKAEFPDAVIVKDRFKFPTLSER